MLAHRILLDYVRKWSRAQEIADYFGQQSFLRLVILMALFAWLWVGYNRQVRQLDPGSGLAFMLVIIGVTVLIYWLYQSHYLWTICIFLLTQLFFITGTLWLVDDLDVAYIFIVPIFIAGALLGPIGAFTTAGVAIIIQLVPVKSTPGLADGSASLTGLMFLEILAAFVSGQASQGLHNALDAAENNALHASKSADEARLHRGQLQRTLKSLDIAHNQLQRANTELFQAREMADQALRFKAEFAAKVSHELRTSLNLILGFSETMAFAQESYGAKLPATYLRDVTEIYRNSRHLLALVDDILDLSKLEVGRMGLRREPVDLVAILHETTDLIRPLVETKGLELVLDLPRALPTLMLDRTRINQVLLNLLSNATRITSSGQITVEAELHEDEVIIKVSDTGPGIPLEDLERVFEEFRQLDSTKGEGSTTGLGLTVSKQIVELHSGRMWAESVWGQGSTFSFTLPLQESKTNTPIMRKSVPPYRVSQPAIVVIGEEESDEVKLLQRHLEGYTLAAAHDWDEAKRLVVQVSGRAMLVNAPLDEISDPLSLPVPLVACSLPGPQQSTETLNVDSYLQKPVTVETVQAALSQVAPTAKSLLIVDDNPSAVRMLERMVQAAGSQYRVFRAYSGNEALARVKAQPPDAILLDLVMPDGDGYTLIEALRGDATTDHIPIVVISGQSVEETYQGGPIGIFSEVGFTPTETLKYLQAILSAIPPTLMERHTTAPVSSEEHPA